MVTITIYMGTHGPWGRKVCRLKNLLHPNVGVESVLICHPCSFKLIFFSPLFNFLEDYSLNCITQLVSTNGRYWQVIGGWMEKEVWRVLTRCFPTLEPHSGTICMLSWLQILRVLPFSQMSPHCIPGTHFFPLTL